MLLALLLATLEPLPALVYIPFAATLYGTAATLVLEMRTGGGRRGHNGGGARKTKTR